MFWYGGEVDSFNKNKVFALYEEREEMLLTVEHTVFVVDN